LRRPVCSITDTSFSAEQLFVGATETETELLACREEQDMVEMASRFLLGYLPPHDPGVEDVCSIVEMIVADPDMTRVEDLIARCGMTERALQRMFRRYTGVSPRWVIKRYRVYEALGQMSDGTRTEWAALAQDLGYYDQAHFINDFKRLVGRSPSEYIRT
jgi:AraC-like DNA-binding protein